MIVAIGAGVVAVLVLVLSEREHAKEEQRRLYNSAHCYMTDAQGAVYGPVLRANGVEGDQTRMDLAGGAVAYAHIVKTKDCR